jgi:hypothetical protein
MERSGLATALLLIATTATAQTMDKTFEQLGSKFDKLQKTLAPTSPLTALLTETTTIYSRPAADAATSMKLNANSPVIIHQIKDGYAAVSTKDFPGIFYIPRPKE